MIAPRPDVLERAATRSCIEYIDRVTTVRLATLNDLPQIAQVQMRAFQFDPLITWMLPPDDFERRADRFEHTGFHDGTDMIPRG